MLPGLPVLLASLAMAGAAARPAGASGALADDPADARYEIAERFVPLSGGVAETPAAPGSATMVRTQVSGSPVYGDLDGDGDEDAVLWLVQEPGGSGTFHHVAAAIREVGGFRGTRAFLLGDRIAPKGLSVEHRVVTARFADRRPSEPMATRPTVDTARYFTGVPDGLKPAAGVATGEALLHGWLVIGHEVRAFQPCADGEPLWLSGDALTTGSLARAYHAARLAAAPYAPLFATIIGRRVEAPADGFGADYAGGFEARELVQTWPSGNCISDRILVEQPRPGSRAASPLAVRGRARGAWFFEAEVTLQLFDGDGSLLARGFGTARSDWMTEGFVPFEGTLAFDIPAAVTQGVLVVKRNNPSDNRDLDEALEIPLRLGPP